MFKSSKRNVKVPLRFWRLLSEEKSKGIVLIHVLASVASYSFYIFQQPVRRQSKLFGRLVRLHRTGHIKKTIIVMPIATMKSRWSKTPTILFQYARIEYIARACMKLI